MSYQVLARKWRPKSFDTLIGQESAVQAISNALDQNRLHHAYLFNGTRGIGKTTIARILAKSLNCEKKISSKPCQTCSACKNIDAGRYIDLIELDAASNTGVDNMIELLENAQYAPSSGRFKVYIIDEVHMLSKSAFNAMLKTLEEPPEHVKFILATTELNKVPVTVLSRCLQFNLRQMTGENIAKHLNQILTEEKINAEDGAIKIIAKAANGSMRDALSILDQAIAYSEDNISTVKVMQMLGSIDDEVLFNIIQALIAKDGVKILNIAKEMDARNTSFEIVLNDLSKLLHDLTICKIIPEHQSDSNKKDWYQKLSSKLTAESLQLFYQICINGKRDLYLAPDPITGFSTTLLRMLAFYPTVNQTKIPLSTPPNKNSDLLEKKSLVDDPVILKTKTTPKENKDLNKSSPITNNTAIFKGDWRLLVGQLKTGVAKSLAQECQFKAMENNTFHLLLDETQKYLSKDNYIEKLEEALTLHYSKKIKVIISIEKVQTSPSIEKNKEKALLLEDAKSAIMQDNLVKEFISEFDAEIIPSSIEPIKKGK